MQNSNITKVVQQNFILDSIVVLFCAGELL